MAGVFDLTGAAPDFLLRVVTLDVLAFFSVLDFVRLTDLAGPSRLPHVSVTVEATDRLIFFAARTRARLKGSNILPQLLLERMMNACPAKPTAMSLSAAQVQVAWLDVPDKP